MKCVLFFTVLGLFTSNVWAQSTVEKSKYCEDVVKHLKSTDVFYDFKHTTLKSEDTITDFLKQSNKLKISGTVFKADGVTPAENIILFFQQANSEGYYTLIADTNGEHLQHRAWVKTDNNGRYTIYTFMPGATNKPLTYPHEPQAIHMHVAIKEPGKTPYNIPSFLFNTDPNLTTSCIKRLTRKDADAVLQVTQGVSILETTKNIVLKATENNS
ncbi:hypothetical protein ACFSQP_03590 [Bizionia sediminis]|uniref:Intradiol ring-cleavage dioxygenases domain-containing protein n=1 Tax=Bizionia sediminis TaxID=1737064 RepID=A0ABW5KPF5_9FLAO